MMKNHALDPESKGYGMGYESKMYSADSKSGTTGLSTQFYKVEQPSSGSSNAAASLHPSLNDLGTDDWYTANSTASSAKNSPTSSPQHANSNSRNNTYTTTTMNGNSFENPAISFLGGLLSSFSGSNRQGPAPVYGATYPSIDEDDNNYDNEPPLLEELGVNFEHIWAKTQAVMYPRKRIDEDILSDTDLAGPLVFCLLLGSCLLLSGKVHFGYIYGFSVFGCLGLMLIINLLHPVGLDFWTTCSALGYCLIPVIILAAVSILVNLQGILGFILSVVSIAWATLAATRLLDARLRLTETGQYWLIAYPIMLLYSCFVLITIF